MVGWLGTVAHDFFTSQPFTNPSVYLLKLILHDWADEKAITILKTLRNSAGLDTSLVLLEQIVPYACDDNSVATTIEGAATPLAPAPLLPNMGLMGQTPYVGDIIVCITTAIPIVPIPFTLQI